VSALPDTMVKPAELARRELLARSDQLLDEVERLRLAEQRRVPSTLREAIRGLQRRVGREEGVSPRTVRAAQLLVFTVQQRLMAANPRNKQPRGHLGRALGTPRVTRLPSGAAWKFLTLPPPPGPPADAEWRDHVRLVVERAFDRWSIAQSQAVAAARAAGPALPAVRRARAAWENYWDLCSEAERLLGASVTGSSARSSAAVSGAAEAATREATASRKPARRSSSSSSASWIAAPAAEASPGASRRSSCDSKPSGSE
jgi:hypothetical protein